MSAFILRVFIGFSLLCGSWLQDARAAENLIVRPKPPQAIELGEAIPISVSVGASVASGVRAGTVNMNLKGNGRSIAPKGLKLCPTADVCDGRALALEANKTHSLWLHGAEAEGVYEGTVQIEHADSAGGNAALATTISVSSTSAKAVGVACIAGSVLVAFVFTVVLRHYSNRKSLLVAAAVIREAVYALQASLAKLQPTLFNAATATSAQLPAVLGALDEPTLEQNGLPTNWAVPLTDANLAAYKAYVSAQALRAQGIKVVIEEGLHEIDALIGAQGIAANDPAVLQAVKDVEAAGRFPAAVPPTEDVVRLAVQAALKNLAAKNAKALVHWAPLTSGATGARQLQLQVANLNRAMWIVVLLLTTGVGAAALVLTGSAAASFGTLEDYVRCVLWGLGLSAGTQLTSMSSSTVTAAFAIPKPL